MIFKPELKLPEVDVQSANASLACYWTVRVQKVFHGPAIRSFFALETASCIWNALFTEL